MTFLSAPNWRKICVFCHFIPQYFISLWKFLLISLCVYLFLQWSQQRPNWNGAGFIWHVVSNTAWNLYTFTAIPTLTNLRIRHTVSGVQARRAPQVLKLFVLNKKYITGPTAGSLVYVSNENEFSFTSAHSIDKLPIASFYTTTQLYVHKQIFHKFTVKRGTPNFCRHTRGSYVRDHPHKSHLFCYRTVPKSTTTLIVKPLG